MGQGRGAKGREGRGGKGQEGRRRNVRVEVIYMRGGKEVLPQEKRLSY